jgi:hypothetical protein
MSHGGHRRCMLSQTVLFDAPLFTGRIKVAKL